MKQISLSVGEPFTSPAWGSNFVMFLSETGAPVEEAEFKEYLRRACRYAKHHQVYLVPERFVLLDHHSMCLISPQGRVLGAQQGLYHNLTPESPWKRGEDLEIINTEFGGICLVVDVDIYRPEIPRIAASMGAQILLCSQQITTVYSSGLILTGVWNAAQTAGVYTVGVSDQFHCVCAPLTLTPAKDGFVCSPGQKLPMTAKIRVDYLSSLEPPYRLSRKLYAIHREELAGSVRAHH